MKLIASRSSCARAPTRSCTARVRTPAPAAAVRWETRASVSPGCACTPSVSPKTDPPAGADSELGGQAGARSLVAGVLLGARERERQEDLRGRRLAPGGPPDQR